MKKFRVLENYERHIFSEKKKINWGKYSDVELTICDEPVYHWFESGDSWNNAEFDFDTLEQAKSFIDEQIAKVEYVEINQEFEAYSYMIMQYNEDTEEYDIACTIDCCEHWEKIYKPKYSSEQVKDELYYYIDNLNTKQLVELNNFIFTHQTEHTSYNCVNVTLEYDEDKSINDYDICIDEFVDFIFWNDKLSYGENINYILKNHNNV